MRRSVTWTNSWHSFLLVQVIHSLSVNMTNSHTVESGLWHWWRAQPGLQASQGTEASLCFSRWGRNNEQQTQKCLTWLKRPRTSGTMFPHDFCHFWAGFVGVIGSEHGQPAPLGTGTAALDTGQPRHQLDQRVGLSPAWPGAVAFLFKPLCQLCCYNVKDLEELSTVILLICGWNVGLSWASMSPLWLS